MKKLCALLCMTLLLIFQQDDTKIVSFDEGVLILEPFSMRQCHFNEFDTYCIKSHV